MILKHLRTVFSKFIWILVIVVVCPGLKSSLWAAEKQAKRKHTPAKHYQVNAAASHIKIDGVLNEKAWQSAAKIPLPYEWYPGDNIPAPVKTECLVTFTRSKLYVAFKCFDPEPRKIRAHLMNRDALFTFVNDDHISFMLDSFNDERRAFQFRVNPLGVQVDAIFNEVDGSQDFSWDAIWDSAGKITDFGYTIEIAIPFNQLRFPKGQQEQTWGFNAERSYPRTIRYRLSSHIQARDVRCLICQFNKITGFKGISPGRNIELDPTLTVTRTDQREDFPQGKMEPGKIKVEPGITAKWGVTPNLILNATINPDFSHVEADVAQLEVNTRFALRYPEKRPFFLEGADFFSTPMEAVFTRTVFDPVWGVKTTGKIGKNALGFIAAQDRYNSLIFPSNQYSQSASLEKDVYTSVFRYRRDVGKSSTLGVLYTGRVNDDYYNHVLGIDGFFRLSRAKIFNIQFLRSETKYPVEIAQAFNQELDNFGGNALMAQFLHLGRKVHYSLEYEDLSPNFRADYGFMPRVDIRRIKGNLLPIIWGKRGSWFNRLTFRLWFQRITDHDNNLTNQDVDLSSLYEGPLQSIVEPGIRWKKEFYNGITYDMTQYRLLTEMSPTGGVKFLVFGQYGDAIDYSNSRLARSLFINPGIDLSLGKHLNIQVTHIYERLALQGNKIYIANLSQGRFVYNFNVKTFIRAIVQYTHIDRDVNLYRFPIEPISKILFTQFLFSYKLNPQTVLFIGYSDNYLGIQGIDITRTDRTFFLKIGYALTL